ncbi:hypothetical protein ACIQWL_08735 [Streptomyces mirabilis]
MHGIAALMTYGLAADPEPLTLTLVPDSTAQLHAPPAHPHLATDPTVLGG